MTPDANKKRVVVKIGSSSLTSLHGEISRRKLEKLVEQVVRLKDNGHEVILVSSGAVAAGYRKLGFIKRPESLPEKQAAASIGQGLLMEAYSEIFLSHGYVASQILITKNDFSDEYRYNNVRNTLNVLLDRGIVPIINENDTVTVDRLKFGDNDTLSAKVAGLIDSDLLVILSDIDGLYDANPMKHPEAKRIKKVTEITPEIEAAAGEAGSSVGTGGMRSKLDAFNISMASGIQGFLGQADSPNILQDVVNGTASGTYFEPNSNAHCLSQKMQWIAFNSGPEGDLVIGNKKKEDIVNNGSSFHPSEVLEVRGEFNKGSVVRIIDLEGTEIGLGIVNYSSNEFHMLTETNAACEEAIDKETFVCHLDVKIPVC